MDDGSLRIVQVPAPFRHLVSLVGRAFYGGPCPPPPRPEGEGGAVGRPASADGAGPASKRGGSDPPASASPPGKLSTARRVRREREREREREAWCTLKTPHTPLHRTLSSLSLSLSLFPPPSAVRHARPGHRPPGRSRPPGVGAGGGPGRLPPHLGRPGAESPAVPGGGAPGPAGTPQGGQAARRGARDDGGSRRPGRGRGFRGRRRGRRRRTDHHHRDHHHRAWGGRRRGGGGPRQTAHPLVRRPGLPGPAGRGAPAAGPPEGGAGGAGQGGFRGHGVPVPDGEERGGRGGRQE